MRYAILSDVHGNLEALRAVIDAAKEQGARLFYCCGDVVGYGANPKECIDTLNDIKAVVIAGNHDWAVCGKYDPKDFTDVAKSAVDWTRRNITTQHKEYLEHLPLVYKNDDLVLVHGTLNKPEKFLYLFDARETLDTFYLMDRDVCFLGHTHVPGIFIKKNDVIMMSDAGYLGFEPGSKYIVNVGSVGQPRDNNPEACFCIYDPDLQRIEMMRVGYDIAVAQRKIREAALPDFLAARLAVGQ